MAIYLFIGFFIFTLLVLYHHQKWWVWDVGVLAYFVSTVVYGDLAWSGLALLVFGLSSLLVLCHFEPLRLKISGYFFDHIGQSIPALSKTEQEALNAGDTWLEASIFQGKPDWRGMTAASAPLSHEERAFLDYEVETLCNMLHEWTVFQTGNLPEAAWSYIREQGFFGLVIDKAYGGRGFSARAHSDIVMKIASRCGAAAVTVMVPNSLGPGELLQYYGTASQKDYYLPRLARGIDIPCFALTEPGAGSDATSIEAEAVVVKRIVRGQAVLGLRISLNKRWITLAPVATLIGLAVNLKDPDGLLEGRGSEGITCVLMPRDTPNLEIGNRHLPVGEGFMNGSIRGHDIFVPVDNIIGGIEKAGSGWQMLVECLSIGRSISLPALAAAFSSVSYVTTSAYAKVRRQFRVSIGEFEGVQEKLAEMAGLNYLIQSTRLLTIAAVACHKKPSVASAITKYFNTEFNRIVVNHAMDIHGGRAVVLGPRNYLAQCYRSLPIAITVEGANIMTRNLLIFGQGSMACHPYVRDEFYAVTTGDRAAFHRLLWAHGHYFLRNFVKTICSSLSGGHLIQVPERSLKRSYQSLTRLSYAFALLSDFALMVLGGDLKRRERLSARLADAMSYLYMAMGALRLYREQDHDEAVKVHAQWALSYCFYQASFAMRALCDNFSNRLLGKIMKWVMFPFGQTFSLPTDRQDRKLSQLMMTNNTYRNLLKKWLFLSKNKTRSLERVEDAFQQVLAHEALYQRIKDLKRYPYGVMKEKLEEKVKSGEMTADEMTILLDVENARWDAIQVDEFAFDSLLSVESKRGATVAAMQGESFLP